MTIKKEDYNISEINGKILLGGYLWAVFEKEDLALAFERLQATPKNAEPSSLSMPFGSGI